MSDTTTIAGEMVQGDRPQWEPVLALVGELLVGELMWMFEIALADGVAVHAYKHSLTRRYLHIAEDGRTLVFTGSGRYRPIDPYDALVAVFDGWEQLADERYDDVDALRAALREAYRRALSP